ncbi:MAG: hypothetical protein NZ700_00765 [Gemmataceae bacterium]|nr:hypothetical protein [Gemmataceae bacterium]MDW8264079.1 hypothetical protein [Gemmataceae bacterium]
MARRILNRKELRADYEAAERAKAEEEELEEESDEEEDEDEDEEEEEDEDLEAESDDDDLDDDEAPRKKKKKSLKTKAKPRPRTPKVTRMRVVWGVFNNSNQRVATFDYPKRREADELAAKLTAEKKNTHFVQPVKEPMEEKKDKG